MRRKKKKSSFATKRINLDFFFFLLIRFGVFFSLFHHAFDLLVRKTWRRFDRDVLLFAGTQIFRADVDAQAQQDGGAGAKKADDNVVDAEYEEVNDDKDQK